MIYIFPTYMLLYICYYIWLLICRYWYRVTWKNEVFHEVFLVAIYESDHNMIFLYMCALCPWYIFLKKRLTEKKLKIRFFLFNEGLVPMNYKKQNMIVLWELKEILMKKIDVYKEKRSIKLFNYLKYFFFIHFHMHHYLYILETNIS